MLVEEGRREDEKERREVRGRKLDEEKKIKRETGDAQRRARVQFEKNKELEEESSIGNLWFLKKKNKEAEKQRENFRNREGELRGIVKKKNSEVEKHKKNLQREERT